MARQESDREDLFREATALVERIELAPISSDDVDAPVVIGFRRDGSMSVYFGADPAYHFNSSGQLRRAYCGGLLFKAEHGTLVSLERARQESEVQLVRRPLIEAEQAQFLAEMAERLRDVVVRCGDESLTTTGQVPADADVLGRALAWLPRCASATIAASPHVR